MKKRTVWTVVVIAGLIAAGIFFLLVAGPSGESGAQQPGNRKPAPLVRAAAATEETISRELELTGSVEPDRVARLASPAEGPIADIRVREGDRVQAGDLLLTIGRKEGADALIESLREELKKEEDNLRRTHRLVESEALPGENLDQARAAFEKVRALLIKAEETAGDYTIRAPWNGVVSRLPVKEGEFVAPRETLVEIYDPSSLVILAAVPEKHAAAVAGGLPAEVRLDAYPNRDFSGRIERVYPYLDSRLRTRTIEVVLDRPVDLLPGMFARLKVALDTVPDALVVPTEAVLTAPSGERYVFVADQGKARRHVVGVGIEQDQTVQILSGLGAGERVVVAGQAALGDGQPVRLSGEGSPDKGKSAGGRESKSENSPAKAGAGR